jgi:hypothetical protein
MENVYSGDIAITMGQQNGWDEVQSQRAKAFLQQQQLFFSWLGVVLSCLSPETPPNPLFLN